MDAHARMEGAGGEGLGQGGRRLEKVDDESVLGAIFIVLGTTRFRPMTMFFFFGRRGRGRGRRGGGGGGDGARTRRRRITECYRAVSVAVFSLLRVGSRSISSPFPSVRAATLCLCRWDV